MSNVNDGRRDPSYFGWYGGNPDDYDAVCAAVASDVCGDGTSSDSFLRWTVTPSGVLQIVYPTDRSACCASASVIGTFTEVYRPNVRVKPKATVPPTPAVVVMAVEKN